MQEIVQQEIEKYVSIPNRDYLELQLLHLGVFIPLCFVSIPNRDYLELQWVRLYRHERIKILFQSLIGII